MYACMKTISIRDDVYEWLLRLKGDGESFSDVIEKLLMRKGLGIEEYFGCLRDSPILEEIAEYSRKLRESARLRI
jgi:predicted CopG family antitoxin